MARQRSFTKKELLDATENLLLECGYEGFQLKLLAQSLPGARSTIYEYYANKEEIISACMRRMMETIMQDCQSINEEDPVQAIRTMLTVFLRHAGFHKLMVAAEKVNPDVSEHARNDLSYIESGHQLIKGNLMSLFNRAQAEGSLRQDIPVPIIASVFFHAIDTPNWMNLPTEQWADMLFKLWWNGGENRANSI